MLRLKVLTAAALALVFAACGGGESGSKEAKAPENPSGKKTGTGVQVSKEAAVRFESALEVFLDYDKKQNWTPDTCKEVAGLFKEAGVQQFEATNRPFAEAIYNAGLAHQRCGEDDKARERFEAALEADASFHRAKAQLVLYDFQKTKDLDSAISSLDTVIRDAKYQNVEGLVALAALQMERGNGDEDLQAAKLNLQRALAIDDSFMPAFNQLAIYYLEQAKAKAGSADGKSRRRGMVVSGAKGADVNAQQLDLAALVASQAMAKNPFYAPIHNTAGLIQVELRNYNSAVQSFGKARKLDPSFFEAHMNYAAVNLSFRGFEEAQKAYEAALKLKPKTFEAHLGLALAIRGQMDMSNRDKLLPKATEEIKKARELEPNRPETYYNEAILVQEYKAKGVNEDQAVKELLAAASIYDDFVNRASGEPAFAPAVKRATERAQDARDTATFIKEGKAARLQEEADAKARKAEEERKKKEEAAQKKEEERLKKEEAKRASEEAKRLKEEEARQKKEGKAEPAKAEPAKAAPAKAAPAKAAPAKK